MKELRKQYDNFADTFSKNHAIGENSNDFNRADFYTSLSFLKPEQKILDLCCGDGLDANNYFQKGCEVWGLDASEALLTIAKQKYPGITFNLGFAEKLPYERNMFDAVVSKYAIMTSFDMQPIFNEVHRVLKQNGHFAYLVTHPFRQYFEKCSIKADYFKQEVVTSNILNNTVSLQEPTHTLNEYFSKEVLGKFDLIEFRESWDPAAEAIEGRKYPGYFIAVYRKR